MHPPPFRRDHRLSDWPECRLELTCLWCRGRSTVPAIRLLLDQHGDCAFAELLRRLRCGQPSAPVHLLAGWHRTFLSGAAPDLQRFASMLGRETL